MNRRHRDLRAMATRIAVLLALAGGQASAQRAVILATTTSTQDSGLLDVLVPRFRAETGIEVKVIAVGSGAALKMACKGDADVVLSHAPAAEDAAVAAGDLLAGRRVMHNDFVLLGPPADPAGARGATDVAAAFRAIAERGRFVSRGDDSGTHKMELELWKAAGLEPAKIPRREETGQGMGATLQIASEKTAYTLADRGTFLALRGKLRLEVVLSGDRRLRNPYRVLVVNPMTHPRVNEAGARAFAEFLVSQPIQRLIADFRRAELGEAVFFPDALSAGPAPTGPRGR